MIFGVDLVGSNSLNKQDAARCLLNLYRVGQGVVDLGFFSSIILPSSTVHSAKLPTAQAQWGR